MPGAAALLLLALAIAGASSVTVDLADADLDVPELVAKYGYPVEEHAVETSDGYLLKLHRIPHGKDNADRHEQRQAILLMHGLLSSSADFVIMGPEIALGYILADAGFDVWLGNARGNYYSRHHQSLNPDAILSSSFWTFSWDEIGNIDVPAMVDHILATTGLSSIHYAGHSQGTTAFFVLGALQPDFLKKFRCVHLMAPVAFMNHFQGTALESMANYANTLLNFGSVIGMSELYPRGSLAYQDGEVVCVNEDMSAGFCSQLVEEFVTKNTDSIIDAMLPVIVKHFTAGSSLKQMAHFGQVISSNNDFRRWSYTTPLQNLAAYGSLTPPSYNLANIHGDIHLHYSGDDTLTPEPDVNTLYGVLPHSVMRKVPTINFTHFDFAWGSDAKEAVYTYIIDKMNEYDSTH